MEVQHYTPFRHTTNSTTYQRAPATSSVRESIVKAAASYGITAD